MAVAVSATGTVLEDPGNATINYTGLTAHAGDTALVVWIASLSAKGQALTTGTPTWAASNMTELVSYVGANVAIQLWGIVSPTSGNQTLAIPNGNTLATTVLAQSYIGSLTNINTAFNYATANGSNSAGPASVFISGDPTALLLGGFAANGVTISAVNQTSVFIDTGAPSTAGNRATGGPNVNLTATLSGAADWGAVAVTVQSVVPLIIPMGQTCQ